MYKKLYAIPLNEIEIKKLNKISDYSKNQIKKEFEELIKNNQLFSKPNITSFQKPINQIKALCLHICHDCNLSCRYCFAKEGTYNTQRDYMSLSVGKASIDFLIHNSGNIKNLEVDFFGGEPLLNIDVVKQIVEYAKIKAEQAKKTFDFTLTTNCINLNEETRDFLNREMVNVVLSIDGRKETHDKVRCTRSGISVYSGILNNALEFVKIRGEKKYYVRGTFTSENLDFSKDVLFLNDVGFSQISFEPVVLPQDNYLSLKNEDIEFLKNEYHILAEEYIKRRKTSKWFNFFHYMIDLERGPCINKRLTGCGAGAEYLAV
ncbi:MAG: 4Fe-4S cluster-binding domain-containing protein, partial [Bacilli bacterium]|nr:4Fe-4S cluster-binding domain-containing protein [Bacilli bacterium]